MCYTFSYINPIQMKLRACAIYSLQLSLQWWWGRHIRRTDDTHRFNHKHKKFQCQNLLFIPDLKSNITKACGESSTKQPISHSLNHFRNIFSPHCYIHFFLAISLSLSLYLSPFPTLTSFIEHTTNRFNTVPTCFIGHKIIKFSNRFGINICL